MQSPFSQRSGGTSPQGRHSLRHSGDRQRSGRSKRRGRPSGRNRAAAQRRHLSGTPATQSTLALTSPEKREVHREGRRAGKSRTVGRSQRREADRACLSPACLTGGRPYPSASSGSVRLSSPPSAGRFFPVTSRCWPRVRGTRAGTFPTVAHSAAPGARGWRGFNTLSPRL